MNWFAILLVVSIVVWGIILLDALITGRSQRSKATQPIPRKVTLGPCGGALAIQGARPYMEDAHQASLCVGGDPQCAIYSVFDGHGGSRAANFAALHLHRLLINALLTGDPNTPPPATPPSAPASGAPPASDSSVDGDDDEDEEDPTAAATASNNAAVAGVASVLRSGRGVAAADAAASATAAGAVAGSGATLVPAIPPAEALRSAFLALDAQWLRLAGEEQLDDGCTCVCALIWGGYIYVANIGDSRAILCALTDPPSSVAKGPAPSFLSGALPPTQTNVPDGSSDFAAAVGGRTLASLALSTDHKPRRPDERRRIEALGGRIIFHGTWRVEGALALTRAFGDRRLKRYVTADPEIMRRRICPADIALVLATDGVWDVLSNAEAAALVGTSPTPAAAAKVLTVRAFTKGSQDNITSVVVDLRLFRAPRPSVSPSQATPSNAGAAPISAESLHGPRSHAQGQGHTATS